ncbi:MAG: nitrous oxide reductase accessory protein NosL [Cognaticolwellia aestuarii]
MLKTLFIISITIILISCVGDSNEEKVFKAVAFESTDECHLCGMIIEGFGGPKGAASNKTDSHIRKFCSTRDLFSYYLDPENKRNVKTLLVHDMGSVPWETPDDELMINAEVAWYVVGSSKKGAMGLTIATFGDKSVAQTFAEQFGGDVVSFEQITYDHITSSRENIGH